MPHHRQQRPDVTLLAFGQTTLVGFRAWLCSLVSGPRSKPFLHSTALNVRRILAILAPLPRLGGEETSEKRGTGGGENAPCTCMCVPESTQTHAGLAVWFVSGKPGLPATDVPSLAVDVLAVCEAV